MVTGVALAYPSPALATTDATAARTQAASLPKSDGTYVVQLADEPVAGYAGAVKGLRATRPAAGAKVDPAAPDVRAYLGHLAARRNAALAKVPGAKKLYDYNYSFAGFAAKLTGAQAATLAAAPGIASVTKDEIRQLDTVSTPDFLGLTGETGVWQKQYSGPARAGDGVIFGSIDSGVWPENPSFAALPASPTDAKVKRRFKGICDEGLEAPYFRCNNKVIGGRYFVRGLGPDNVVRGDYLSPRDFGGHGSHTSSTAAGNHGVVATVGGRKLGAVSGMAPAARVAVYKVCWIVDDEGSDQCATSDAVAAIDAAVADGVDVLNYSISGSRAQTIDPVELAFFRAAEAGVFVAASAGNSGPSVSTVAHNSPWLTTVAAGTHDRSAVAKVTLGNGQSYTGVGLGAAVPSAPVVLSSAVGKPDAPANEVTLCFLGRLDPAKVAGKIVVCDRGVNARTDKSKEVRDAGGAGMILANTSANSLNADVHFVPTVHVDHVAGAAIKTYVKSTDAASAQLSEGVIGAGAVAPKVASFSSRGPALAGSGDLLKPDLMGPGVDVLAAVAPPQNSGRDWDFYSGTSMSAPHIAGLGALIVGKHPRWSPMAVKSSLMTTAVTRDNKGEPITTDTGGIATARDYGAGHVAPANAFNPGLVYDSTAKDWTRYLCGTGEASGPLCSVAGGAIDPSDLNMPSMSIGALPGVQTLTRTVTSVASKTRTYQVSVEEPPGVDITVSPSKFTIAPGQKRTFTVTLNRVSAPFEEYAYGSLTWNDGSHRVRSPIAVRPVAIATPVEVSGKGAAGSMRLTPTAGYDGTMKATLAGLVPSAEHTANLRNPSGAPFPGTDPKPTEHTAKFTVTVPEGTKLARFALFDDQHPAGTDLDLYVYKAGTATQVGTSGGASAEERVDLGNVSGSYDVYVELYAIGGAGTSVDAKLHAWAVGDAAAGNATVDPQSQSVVRGATAPLTLNWSGLQAGRRWLGRLTLSDGGTASATTIVRVDS
jgi:hypothetical protein